MKKIKWLFAKFKSKLIRSQEPILNYYRSLGCKIGKDCLICSDISNNEAYLIEVGNRTTISTDVTFVTHDFSAHNVIEGKSDLHGKIIIGDNCFVGTKSIIMYGVRLSDNIIVAAGSVVTKSFDESFIIIGGNPAKKIGNWDNYRQKYINLATPNNTKKKIIKKAQLEENKYLVNR